MLVNELKEFFSKLPDDADIITQNKLSNNKTLVSGVEGARITKIKNSEKLRLVLFNQNTPISVD